MIEDHEKRFGVRFEWVVKIRPDLLFLGPFSSLASFSRKYVFVNKARSDHVFLCPRTLCRGFLVDASSRQMKCETGADFGFHSNLRLEFMGYPREVIDDIQLSYVIFRSEEGAACSSGLPPSCKQIMDVVKSASVSDELLFEAIWSIVSNTPTRRAVPAGAAPLILT